MTSDPPLRRVAWFVVGGTAMGLGTAGALLPILPTTPFVLLAAFAFGHCSPALAARLERSRLFGPAIADWRAGGAIAPRAKAIALAMMVGVLVLGVMLSAALPVLAVQIVAVTAASVFILSRPNGTG